MSTAINLGPLADRNPSEGEAIEIRENLFIGTAGILDATFTAVGNDVRLKIEDPTNPAYSVELSAVRLYDTRANKLITPRKIYIADRNVQNITLQIKPDVPGSAFSRTNQTVTVNLTGHGYTTGDLIEIDGLNEIELRGRYSITIDGLDRFFYNTSTSGAISQATGTTRLIKEIPTGAITAQLSDISTPQPYAEFDGTRDHVIVGQIKPRVVLRRHIEDWLPAKDGFTNSETGTATGISTAKIQNGAITPAKISVNGPSWDEVSGNTSISGSLEVSGGKIIVDSAYTTESQTITGGSFSSVSTLVTVTKNAHGYVNDDVITVKGLNEAILNGTHKVTRIGPNSFTYTVPGASGNITGTGTATVYKRVFATDGGGRIILSGRGTNLLSDYNSSKSWMIIAKDSENSTVVAGDFEIQGEVSAKILDKKSTSSKSSVASSSFTRFSDKKINVAINSHGFVSNDVVTVSGLAGKNALLLNGTFKITVTDANNFTYDIPLDVAVSSGVAIVDISGSASITKTILDGSTGIGLRIDRGDDTVLVPQLSSFAAINASKFTPNAACAANSTDNDFEGTARSARVWTQARTFDTNLSGTHVKFTFDRIDGSENRSVAATIQKDVIEGGTATSNSMIKEKTITTYNIADDAVTSDKLADNITIADTLTVQQASTTLKGILFGVNTSAADNARIHFGTGSVLNFNAKNGYSFETGTSDFIIASDGDTSIPGKLAVTGATTMSAALSVSGTISAINADIIAYASSDVNLKNDIKNIQSPLEKVSKLNGVSFTWNSLQDTYNGYDLGVIAQEVEEVFPEIVTTRDTGYKAVRYEKLIPLLIECVKELKAQNEELNSKIQQLTN